MIMSIIRSRQEVEECLLQNIGLLLWKVNSSDLTTAVL